MREKKKRIDRTVIFPLLIGLLIVPIVLVAHVPDTFSNEGTTLIESEHSTVRLLRDQDYFPVLIRAIDNAMHEIVVSVFLFKTNGFENNRPDILLSHLIQAAKRQVTVKVVLEREKDSTSTVNRNNEETAKRLKKGDIDVCFDSPGRTTHTKVIVIDRRYTFIGSHNLTNSALKYNHEISVLIDSQGVADEVLRYIDALCA